MKNEQKIKYIDSFIKDLEEIKNDDSVDSFKFMVFMRAEGIRHLIQMAEAKHEINKDEGVFFSALELFFHVVQGDLRLMLDELRDGGHKKECSSCPAKSMCDRFKDGQHCESEKEESPKDMMEDFLSRLENDLGKWN